MKKISLAAWFVVLLIMQVNAQNYHAIQGSSYAGALGVQNNPASIVNTPFTWDVVVFGAQVQSSTNTFSIRDYSLLSNPANSLYHVEGGNFSRKANIDFNLNLLNARIALNRKSAIAFGVNIRSYNNLKTSQYNYSDTLHGVADFFKINQGLLTDADGKLLSSTWLEGYITYARTLLDNASARLNAGITIKISKGLSGAYANINNTSFTQNNTADYDLSAANLVYGYSSNYDLWKKGNSTSQNIKNLYSGAQGGASFDAGIEYLIKPEGTTSFGDEEDYYDYDWKLGLSLTDVGGNQYRSGTQSRSLSGLKSSINGKSLDQTFDSTITTLQRFNDSLATIANVGGAGAKFTVLNPVRLIANIDHYLTGNFYINAELSINIPLTSLKKTFFQVKEINLLTVTPRWETKRYGFYLPIQYNTQNQFWIGGAVKAGPLLLGIHNWASLFSKSSTQNGGGYIAFIIRPFKSKDGTGKPDKRLDCPKPVW